MPFIRVDRLTHVRRTEFPSGSETADAITILSDVSFSLEEGEYVAVIGANGSGKTTLVRHLNGLLIPTSGDVLVDGRSVKDASALPSIRVAIGMVFQSPEDQMIGLTVESEAAFGPENLGLSDAEIDGRVKRALLSMGLYGERHRSPLSLSPGLQQRLAIAGALAVNPRCLVLDEASSMLDPSGRKDLLALLKTLHGDGLTIVAVTNHLDEAAAADRLIVLDRGKLLLDDSPSNVFADPRYASTGLGVPQSAAIVSRLRSAYPAFMAGSDPADVFSAEKIADAAAEAAAFVPNAPPRLSTGSAEKTVERTASVPRPDPSGGDDVVIRVLNLSYSYLEKTSGEIRALDGVSLTVRRGECVAVIGGTGSGKSTLLQHLNGLIPVREGSVEVLGTVLPGKTADPGKLRFAVGLAFQRPEDQLFEQYLGEDVAFGPVKQGLSGAALRERVRTAMERTGLEFESYKYRPVRALSGGEGRRGGLAGVLALEPEILLLDEPAAGLDTAGRESLLGMLRELKENGRTLVVVSHSLEDVSRMADRVYVMKDGRIVREGTASEVLSDAEGLRSAGLEPPFPVRLLERLASRVSGVPESIFSEDGAVRFMTELLSGVRA